jgi:hypothetical protein
MRTHDPSAPSPARRRRRLALAGAATAATAFGLGAALVLGGGAGSGETDLPTLDPVQERQPEVYGEDGCVDLGADVPADCGTTAGELDGVLAGPPGDAFRTLEGFTGPRWTTELQADRLVVLGDTVNSPESGPWTAVGLVRNETSQAQADVEVHARLLDAGGAELDVVEAVVPVSPLRPGEPAPFVVDGTDVPADQVVGVEWNVVGAPAEEAEAVAARSLELTTYWTEPAAQRTPPISVADHEDPATGVGPHLVFGSVTGADGADVGQPGVVAAWIGEDGQVLHVVEATVVGVGGAEPLDHLGTDELGDFVLVLDAPDTDQLATAELALWGVAS